MTMMSPGDRIMNCEQYQTRCAQPKIIVFGPQSAFQDRPLLKRLVLYMLEAIAQRL